LQSEFEVLLGDDRPKLFKRKIIIIGFVETIDYYSKVS
jgi:hypothetical protein